MRHPLRFLRSGRPLAVLSVLHGCRRTADPSGRRRACRHRSRGRRRERTVSGAGRAGQGGVRAGGEPGRQRQRRLLRGLRRSRRPVRGGQDRRLGGAGHRRGEGTAGRRRFQPGEPAGRSWTPPRWTTRASGSPTRFWSAAAPRLSRTAPPHWRRCRRCEHRRPSTFRKPRSAASSQPSTPSSGASTASRRTTSGTTFGVRGEGIVVANIDSGVAVRPPGAGRQYRGLTADGSFDHDYNWFDPPSVCAGRRARATTTATARTPWAPWSATTGGQPDRRRARRHVDRRQGLRDELLLRRRAARRPGSGSLAPTDLDGAEPATRPRARTSSTTPGAAPPIDTWYSDIVEAWVAAGIFPAFSAGNAGPGCSDRRLPRRVHRHLRRPAPSTSTTRSPSSPVARHRARTARSSRTSPRPGVDVRSSRARRRYAAFSGTSMASPHLAGTVALLWSAAPPSSATSPRRAELLERDRRRRRRHHLRRHRRQQQRLGRGQARRPGRRDRLADGADRHPHRRGDRGDRRTARRRDRHRERSGPTRHGHRRRRQLLVAAAGGRSTPSMFRCSGTTP